MYNVLGEFHETLTGWKWKSESRRLVYYGDPAKLTVNVRFDDECKNGHKTFAITGDVTSMGGKWLAGGCLHEDIKKAFPELAHLIKWHLMNEDGPTHYLANVTYLAGDRDYNGRQKGDPSYYDHFVRFGDNPITYKISKPFWEWMKDFEPFDFEIMEYDQMISDKRYYKYTFGGFAEKWHECPFDTAREADNFLYALQHCGPEFITLPTQWSEGKERDLDAARRVAVWPEATDEQLCLPKDELTQLLKDRLPDLMVKFNNDMMNGGLI